MKIELNRKSIEGLKTTGKRYDVRFHGQSARGLLLRVGINGSKTWAFWQKIPGKKETYSNTFRKVEIDPHRRVPVSEIDEVLAWAVQQRQYVQKGGNKVRAKRLSQGPIILSKLYNEYMKSPSKLKNRVSSLQNDERLWRLHIQPEFGNFEVKEITHSEVDHFIGRKIEALRGLGGSGGRANNILSLMSSLMNYAVKHQHIKFNPCFGIAKLKTKHDWPEMTDRQRQNLKLASHEESQMMGLIVDIALITGARKKEILNARWEEFRQNIWTIPIDRKKGKKEHVLTIPPKLFNSLEQWRRREGVISEDGAIATMVRNTGFVFPSNSYKYAGEIDVKTGRRRNAIPENLRPAIVDIKRPWTKIRKKTGMENFRFHDLRHDFGTQLAKAGLDIHSLMHAMGHQRIETTMLYINKAGLNGQEGALAKREHLLSNNHAKNS